MDDGLEKIPLMAVCIFVVCMFGLRNFLNCILLPHSCAVEFVLRYS